MKKIVCELCEGMEFTKVDGMFVCSNCGTKYSAEEAKGMMREVEGDAVAPVGTTVTNVPQGNPNQQQIDNILLLASLAYEAENKVEAENYCNQAIILDAMCYKAWLLKGRAIGWQSTLGNPRIEEAAHSFNNAIDFAPEAEKESVKEQVVEELKNLGEACIGLRGSNFGKRPDYKELEGFTRDRKILIDALAVLSSHGNAVEMSEGYLNSIATIMNNAAVEGFNTVSKRYHSKIYTADDNDLGRCIGEAQNCLTLLQMAIDISDDDEADLQRYENMIAVLEETLEWYSYNHQTLYDSVKQLRKQQISDIRKKIDEIKNKIDEIKNKIEVAKKARIDAYWEMHADEKAALESELKELNNKKENWTKEIAELDAQIKAAEPTGKLSSEDEKSKVKDQISDLNNRRAKLGMFAGKEKKQLGKEIASLEGRLSALDSKIEEEKNARKAEADQKIAPIKTKRNDLQGRLDIATKRIATINKELTKDPEE